MENPRHERPSTGAAGRDPYKILGLVRGAAPEEVRRAYRKMSAIYHPDAQHEGNGDCAQRFLEIQEAFRALRQGSHPLLSGVGPGPFNPPGDTTWPSESLRHPCRATRGESAQQPIRRLIARFIGVSAGNWLQRSQRSSSQSGRNCSIAAAGSGIVFILLLIAYAPIRDGVPESAQAGVPSGQAGFWIFDGPATAAGPSGIADSNSPKNSLDAKAGLRIGVLAASHRLDLGEANASQATAERGSTKAPRSPELHAGLANVESSSGIAGTDEIREARHRPAERTANPGLASAIADPGASGPPATVPYQAGHSASPLKSGSGPPNGGPQDERTENGDPAAKSSPSIDPFGSENREGYCIADNFSDVFLAKLLRGSGNQRRLLWRSVATMASREGIIGVEVEDDWLLQLPLARRGFTVNSARTDMAEGRLLPKAPTADGAWPIPTGLNSAGFDHGGLDHAGLDHAGFHRTASGRPVFKHASGDSTVAERSVLVSAGEPPSMALGSSLAPNCLNWRRSEFHPNSLPGRWLMPSDSARSEKLFSATYAELRIDRAKGGLSGRFVGEYVAPGSDPSYRIQFEFQTEDDHWEGEFGWKDGQGNSGRGAILPISTTRIGVFWVKNVLRPGVIELKSAYSVLRKMD